MKYKAITKTNLYVHSRDNLPKIKDGTYVINLDEYFNIGTHWIALHVLNNNVTHFDSFRVENIFLKKFKKLLVVETHKQIFLEYKHIIR